MEKYIFIGVITVALLILCVQIITEIIKSVITDESKYYNAIVLITSVILTILTVIALSSILKFALSWYIIAGAFVLSFFVAYGAMLGYDKLFKRVFKAVEEALSSINEIKGEDSDEKD